MFRIKEGPLDAGALYRGLEHSAAGAVVIFDGRVRDHHQGRAVLHLAYEAHVSLAERLGTDILVQASSRWSLMAAVGQHRIGHLEIGETAIWIGVASEHRAEAFAACSWIMDRVKETLPVWKRERFADGTESRSAGCPIIPLDGAGYGVAGT